MNEIIKRLEKYFNKKEIEELLNKLETKQRVIIINDKYFAKQDESIINICKKNHPIG